MFITRTPLFHVNVLGTQTIAGYLKLLFNLYIWVQLLLQAHSALHW